MEMLHAFMMCLCTQERANSFMVNKCAPEEKLIKQGEIFEVNQASSSISVLYLLEAQKHVLTTKLDAKMRKRKICKSIYLLSHKWWKMKGFKNVKSFRMKKHISTCNMKIQHK